MSEFLKKRLLEVQEELQQLFIMRANAGIETVGSYTNRITLVRQEENRLKLELKAQEAKQNSTDPTQIKAIAIDFVSKGQFKEALETLKTAFPTENDLIHTMGQLAALERARRMNTISNENYAVRQANISDAVLALIENYCT
ncbi:MAG: Effector-associated domain 11 [Bacteroidota bacterium]|jgi:hypothetical protein